VVQVRDQRLEPPPPPPPVQPHHCVGKQRPQDQEQGREPLCLDGMYGTSTQMMPRMNPARAKVARATRSPPRRCRSPARQLDLAGRGARRTGAAGSRRGRAARAASSPHRRRPAPAAASPSAAARPRHPAGARLDLRRPLPEARAAAARIARAETPYRRQAVLLRNHDDYLARTPG